MATTLNNLWFAILPNITAGSIPKLPGASMAILDIAALDFDPARSFLLQWAMLVGASQSMSRRGPLCYSGAADNALSVLLQTCR